jgi:hypothetical protein
MRCIILTFFVLGFTYLYSQIPVYNPLFSDHVHNVSEVTFNIDSAYRMEYSDSAWKINSIYTVVEKNQYGKMLLGYEYELSDNEEFELSKRWSAEYSGEEYLDSFLKEVWNPDSVNWVLGEVQTWSNNYLTENKTKWWNFDLPDFSYGIGNSYLLNSNYQVIEDRYIGWVLSSEWYNIERYVYTIDTNGILRQHVWQKWNGEEERWDNETRWDYFYESNINTYCFIYFWYEDLNNWVKGWKRTHEFDENGLLIRVNYLQPVDTGYQFNSRRILEYNQMGKEIQRTDERFDTVNNEWDSTYVYRHEYLFDTILTRYYMIHWREDTGIWVNAQNRIWYYNENLQLVRFLVEDGDWTGYKNNEEEIFEYYGDYLNSYEKHRWKYNINHEGYWAPQYREEYYWPSGVRITEEKNDLNLNVYPNPADHFLTLKIKNDKILSVSIFDLTGQELINKSYEVDQIVLEINQLSKGVYVILVGTKHKNIVKKFIKI